MDKFVTVKELDSTPNIEVNKALGISDDRYGELLDSMKDGIKRSTDNERLTISFTLEEATQNCKNINEVALLSFILGRKYAISEDDE